MNIELIECLKEIGEFNILLDTLSEHEKQPNNNRIEQVVLNNIALGTFAIRKLNKENYVPNKGMLNNIITSKFYIEDFFERNGYENNVSKKLGLMYKETLSLIKRISENKVKVDLSKLTEGEADLLMNKYPNLTYKFYLHKFKRELMNKFAQGQEPKLEAIKGFAPIDEIKRLASTDATNWSYNGNDTHRDLRKDFGDESLGEMLDRDMLLACNKLLEKQEQEHLKALGLDKEETLSETERRQKEVLKAR